MNDHFKLENLKELLIAMNRDYDITTFRDWDRPGQVLLRHDIDVDLDKALVMAEMEHELGIKATYFILVSSHYNPFSKRKRTILKKILDAGHEIGLHFDASIYSEIPEEDMDTVAEIEARMLSLAVGEPIYSISVHDYEKNGKQPLFPQFLNAYDPKIFYDEIYWSDSRGEVRKPIFQVLEQTKEGKTVQILMHPIYYGADGYSYRTLLEGTIRAYADEVDTEYRINKAYDEQISKADFMR